MLVRLQEGILHRVARLLRTAQNSEQGTVYTPAVPRNEFFECVGVTALDFSNSLCVGVKALFPSGGTVCPSEKIRDFRRLYRQGNPGLEIRYGAYPELQST